MLRSHQLDEPVEMLVGDAESAHTNRQSPIDAEQQITAIAQVCGVGPTN